MRLSARMGTAYLPEILTLTPISPCMDSSKFAGNDLLEVC